MIGKREWMLGLQGHQDLVSLDEVVLLIRGGQLRETDMVRRGEEPWRNAGEIADLQPFFRGETPKAMPPGETDTLLQPSSTETHALPEVEPMLAKYFSPTDLLRAMTYALAPRKLLVSALIAVPAMVAPVYLRWWLALPILTYALVAAAILLAFLTRRQIEGKPALVGEAARHLARNGLSAIAIPLIGLVPGAACLAVLRILPDLPFAIPFLVAMLVVASGILLQIATMTMSAGLAVESLPFGETAKSASYYLRTQTGRVLLHWFVISLVAYFAWRMGSQMLGLAYALPGVAQPHPLYAGIRDGLALVLPVSLFSTLSVLSFLILRQEDMVYSTQNEDVDETSVSDDR